MRFYYGAYSQGATGADDRTHESGVGVAMLPRDRFAGLGPVAHSDLPTQREPLEHVGQVTLKPLALSRDSQLILNANARAREHTRRNTQRRGQTPARLYKGRRRARVRR